MKRLALFLVTVFFLGLSCYAQNEGAAKTLKDNLAKSDEAIKNPKKESNPATWMTRGKLFQDIYNINISYIRFQMPTTEVVLFFKEPKQILTSEAEGVTKETYEYSQIDLVFENGFLHSWKEKDKIVDDPLANAVEAYQKASSLDEKGKNAKKINEAYTLINNDLTNRMFNEYTNQNIEAAYKTALQHVHVSKLLGVEDTVHYYYAGYFAYEISSREEKDMWQEAIDYFEKAISLGYKETGDLEGYVYTYLNEAYTKLDKPDKALEWLQKGVDKYPNNLNVLYGLINYYMSKGDSGAALSYIAKAKEKDPSNAILLFAEGTLYNDLGNNEKAIESYNTAITVNPGMYDPYFNKAVVYYNIAVKYTEEANLAKTDDEYYRLMGLAEEEFKKAVEPMEKANELKPNDSAIMETLKSLYYRLKSKYPEMEEKYNAINKQLSQE
jgi:tetratricopeptide (TPR) repeat protein